MELAESFDYNLICCGPGMWDKCRFPQKKSYSVMKYTKDLGQKSHKHTLKPYFMK